MQSPGNIIRKARLQAGLSLEQISAKTRIPIRNLQAIEDDEFLYFPSAFFYKSFVRQFANEVKVSYDSLAPQIQVILADIPEPAMPGQGEVIIEKAVLPPVRRLPRWRWLRPIGALAAVLTACTGLYTYWETIKPNGIVQSPITPKSAMNETLSTSRPSPADEGFQVEISGIERSWLAIAADGRQIFNGFLEVDQTKILKGHEVGRIRTGNAGGVSMVFNGKPIGVAGPRGQIRTVVFTKDNYQVLQPTTAAKLTHNTGSLVQLLHLSSPGPMPLLPFEGD